MPETRPRAKKAAAKRREARAKERLTILRQPPHAQTIRRIRLTPGSASRRRIPIQEPTLMGAYLLLAGEPAPEQRHPGPGQRGAALRAPQGNRAPEGGKRARRPGPGLPGAGRPKGLPARKEGVLSGRRRRCRICCPAAGRRRRCSIGRTSQRPPFIRVNGEIVI